MQERLERVQEVPSLYVRVYRPVYFVYYGQNSSLTVCEGVSMRSGRIYKHDLFPHCM